MKYEIHISITGDASFELEAAAELDAESAAQALMDSGKVDWTEYESNVMALPA